MKKLASNIFVACFGGFAALTASHFVYQNDKAEMDQVRNPDAIYRLTSHSSNAMSSNAVDFTMAAEKSVNSVVHIKTITEHVNNLAYDPFAELFFGPQKRQQSFQQQGFGSGVII